MEIWATIARIGTAFVVVVSYPLLMHPARDSVVHILSVLSKGKTDQSQILWYTVAFLLNVLSLGCAYFMMPLDLILGITGSIGVVNLSLTLPFLLYFKLFEDTPGLMRSICIPGIIFGLTMSVVCAYFSLAPLFA